MSNGSELKSLAAIELRKRGYVPLPRWWVKKEDLVYVAKLAEVHAPEISRIRGEIRKKS